MAIVLINESLPARVAYQGSTTVVLAANEKVQIKAPASEELINEGPPVGKTWTVSINVHITET